MKKVFIYVINISPADISQRDNVVGRRFLEYYINLIGNNNQFSWIMTTICIICKTQFHKCISKAHNSHAFLAYQDST